MSINHEEHKIRVKAISDRLNHPIEYNDAGAPKRDENAHVTVRRMDREEMRKMRRDNRERNMITGGR